MYCSFQDFFTGDTVRRTFSTHAFCLQQFQYRCPRDYPGVRRHRVVDADACEITGSRIVSTTESNS